MINTVSAGDVIVVVAAGTISSGDLVRSGNVVGVAVKDATVGQSVAVSVCGVYEVPKLQTDDVSQGDLLYFDESEGELTLTTDTGTNKLAGYAWADSGTSSAVVQVRLLF